jgi:hypothetical protein
MRLDRSRLFRARPRAVDFARPLRLRGVGLNVVIAVGVLVALVAASPAAAALSFTFDRASARPGTVVVASEPSWPSAPSGVTVYLVPTRLAGVRPDPAGGYFLRRPPSHGVVALGRPRLTRAHILLIRFRVPDVRPGDYTTAFWCRTCAKGGDFFASTYWGEAWTGKPGAVLRVTR